MRVFCPLGLLASLLVGCTGAEGSADVLRLGYFANVTHAPAIIGVDRGFFEDALGPDVKLELVTFSSGPEAVEALFSGSVDATFIGPNPAISGYQKSEGDALRVVAGTTSGGASLVVRDGIDSVADLEGTTLATPSLGNTQDVALRSWLADQGFNTDTSAGGDVSIRPQENADTLTAFIDGQIDGAWVPEPWATRLVLEGKGKVLIDESELWPDGDFVTTHLVVGREYLAKFPANIEKLIDGLITTLEWIATNDTDAAAAANGGIKEITSKELNPETIKRAWSNLSFTYDPIASSLERCKDNAVAVGLLDPVDLDGIYDLSLLNSVLKKRGLEEIGVK
jgi:NitT/TauT family transport system substrate-binding protein